MEDLGWGKCSVRVKVDPISEVIGNGREGELFYDRGLLGSLFDGYCTKFRLLWVTIVLILMAVGFLLSQLSLLVHL